MHQRTFMQNGAGPPTLAKAKWGWRMSTAQGSSSKNAAIMTPTLHLHLPRGLQSMPMGGSIVREKMNQACEIVALQPLPYSQQAHLHNHATCQCSQNPWRLA